MIENRSGPGKQILKGNFGPRSLPDAWQRGPHDRNRWYNDSSWHTVALKLLTFVLVVNWDDLFSYR